MSGEPNIYSDGDLDEILADKNKYIAELEARVKRLAGALALCIDNCVDLTEGEVALTRAREVLSGEPTP